MCGESGLQGIISSFAMPNYTYPPSTDGDRFSRYDEVHPSDPQSQLPAAVGDGALEGQSTGAPMTGALSNQQLGVSGTSVLPDVDVVIATHNRPELLRVALEAVLKQTYAGKITCYLVFDQSEPDPSLARQEHTREVVITTNANRSPGLAGARNTGILAGHGTFIAFCDDDDEWLPEKVSLQVEALLRTGRPTSVTGIVVVYDEHESVRIPSQANMTLSELVRNRVMEAHPSSVMVARGVLLNEIGLVDEEIPGSYGEDFDWILRAAQAGDFAVVEKALVRVRWGQSLFSSRWKTIVEAVDYLIAKHPVFLESKQGLARLYGRQAFALAALGQRRAALHKSAEAWKHNPKEKRAYVSAAVALGLVSAPWLMNQAHKRGQGI